MAMLPSSTAKRGTKNLVNESLIRGLLRASQGSKDALHSPCLEHCVRPI